MGIEKRRDRRDKHDSVVEVMSPKGGLKCTGRLADYSASGIAFSSDSEFSKGEKLHARMRILEKGVLDFTGEVVWVRSEKNKTLYGVRFDSVSRVHPTGELKDTWD